MSAIGSVIVMCSRAFCRGFRGRTYGVQWRFLPGALGHAGELTAVSHLPQADPAQAELAVDRLGPAAALAPRVAADRELGLASGLDLECSLRHVSCLPYKSFQLRSAKGIPSCLSSARPSSSFVAVVTTVMSMPRDRSMRSWSISWNMTCSVSPKV